MELSILAVVLGFVLDLLIGDPHWLYHPIRLVGALISALEKLLRGVFPKNKNGELTAGVFLLLCRLQLHAAYAGVCQYAAVV